MKGQSKLISFGEQNPLLNINSVKKIFSFLDHSSLVKIGFVNEEWLKLSCECRKVKVRVWFPSRSNQSIAGHVSLQTFCGGESGIGIYVSFYPKGQIKIDHHVFKSREGDFVCNPKTDEKQHNDQPSDEEIELYTLDVFAINDTFIRFLNSDCRWTTLGSLFNNEKTRNCVGLTKFLLKQGGIDHLNIIDLNGLIVTGAAVVIAIATCNLIEQKKYLTKLSRNFIPYVGTVFSNNINFFIPSVLKRTSFYQLLTKYLNNSLSILNTLFSFDHFVINDLNNERIGFSFLGTITILLGFSGIPYIFAGKHAVMRGIPNVFKRIFIGLGLGVFIYQSPISQIILGVLNEKKTHEHVEDVTTTRESVKISYTFNREAYEYAIQELVRFLDVSSYGLKVAQFSFVESFYSSKYAFCFGRLSLLLNILHSAYQEYVYRLTHRQGSLNTAEMTRTMITATLTGVNQYFDLLTYKNLANAYIFDKNKLTISSSFTLIPFFIHGIPTLTEFYFRSQDKKYKHVYLKRNSIGNLYNVVSIISNLVSLYYSWKYPESIWTLIDGVVVANTHFLFRNSLIVIGMHFADKLIKLAEYFSPDIDKVVDADGFPIVSQLVFWVFGQMTGTLSSAIVNSLFNRNQITFIGNEMALSTPASMVEMCHRALAAENRIKVTDSSTLLSKVGMFAVKKIEEVSEGVKKIPELFSFVFKL